MVLEEKVRSAVRRNRTDGRLAAKRRRQRQAEAAQEAMPSGTTAAGRLAGMGPSLFSRNRQTRFCPLGARVSPTAAFGRLQVRFHFQRRVASLSSVDRQSATALRPSRFGVFLAGVESCWTEWTVEPHLIRHYAHSPFSLHHPSNAPPCPQNESTTSVQLNLSNRSHRPGSE